MQRTSTRFLGCMWQQTSLQQLLRLRQLQPTNMSSPRHLASRSSDKSGDNKTTASSSSSSTPGPTTTVMTPQRSDAGPRGTMREDNLWSDPQKLDTKWLLPRDPNRYRPDFKQTEPHSLRKQFMRSPDERTRDAMGRDWEAAIQLNENRRRQALLAFQKRHQEKLDKQGIKRKEIDRRTRPKASKKDAKNRKVAPPKADSHDED